MKIPKTKILNYEVVTMAIIQRFQNDQTKLNFSSRKILKMCPLCAVLSNLSSIWPKKGSFYKDYSDFGHCTTHSKAVGD